MSIQEPQTNAAQTDFVERVEALWANAWERGLTQDHVANSMKLNYSTLRSRLRYYGFKMVRGGRVVPIIHTQSAKARTPEQ